MGHNDQVDLLIEIEPRLFRRTAEYHVIDQNLVVLLAGLDTGRYREAVAAIREAIGPDLLLQTTTESAGRFAPEEQRANVRELMPEAVSLALRELMADRKQARISGELLRELIAHGSIPQLILYHPGELQLYRQSQAEGLLPPERPAILFVLG